MDLAFGNLPSDSLGRRNDKSVSQTMSGVHAIHDRTLEWFDKNCIPLLPHPPNSPDLNPIEPVWAELKRRLRQLPRHPTTAETLRKAVLKVWDSLTVEDINKYTGSFINRLDAVIEAKGGSTRY